MSRNKGKPGPQIVGQRATIVRGRIESTHNAHLSEMIPVVYGAVLGYAVYVLAQKVLALYPVAVALHPAAITRLQWHQFLPWLAVYSSITFFVVEDFGEVIKYGKSFPMRRTSRYSHELIVAACYVATYSLLEMRSALAWTFFGFGITAGAVWCNQLKQEYLDHDSGVAAFASTQRDLQYVGGGLFIAQSGAFLISSGLPPQIDALRALCFVGTFFVWLLFYSIVPAVRHGSDCNHLMVNILVPDKLVLYFQNVLNLKIKAE